MKKKPLVYGLHPRAAKSGEGDGVELMVLVSHSMSDLVFMAHHTMIERVTILQMSK